MLSEEENTCWLHEMLEFGCLGAGPRQFSWDHGERIPEAQWGGCVHSQPWSCTLAELWPLLCRNPAIGWLWPLIQVQNTPPGQHGCYQVFYDPGKTRNRYWFTWRIMHLLVQPARSCYATGGCFDKVPKQKVHPRAHFPKKH